MPIHAVILAANCGRLPDRWPESRPRPPPSQIIFESGEIANGYRIPLVPFCLPYPKAFEPLVRYMYDHNKDSLLNALVRMKMQLVVNTFNHPPIYAQNAALREGFTRKRRLYQVVSDCIGFHAAQLSKIHEQMQYVVGFWMNAVALAVSDNDLWEMVQIVWEALVLAIKWVRGAHAQIAEDDARRAAAAAEQGLQVMEESPQATVARNRRRIEQYVRTQLQDGLGNCF